MLIASDRKVCLLYYRPICLRTSLLACKRLINQWKFTPFAIL